MEEKVMQEYIVHLNCRPYRMLILALDLAEAYEIACERWGNDHVVQIMLYVGVTDEPV